MVKKCKCVKKILVLFLFFSSLSSFGQKFSLKYNNVVDFDGKKEREYNQSGTISLTDSLFTNEYNGGSFTFKVYKISSKEVYYHNDYGESIKILFSSNGSVIKINETASKEYIIYRRK